VPAKLRFTTGAWSGRDVALSEPEATVGRDPDLQVVIPPADQRFVSRVHATIRKDADRYVLQDRGSSNGTFVNGARITRTVLSDGDEIQFGRQGPLARFICDAAPAGTVVEAVARPPRLPSEPQSEIIRRIVHDAMGTRFHRARRRWAVAALAIAAVGMATVWAAMRSGLFEAAEQSFRRWADHYQERVVLVEVGVAYDGRYTRIGNGTGFFADQGGLIVTNKHVVHSELYLPESACLAQSFRRHGRSYEDALVISVWSGGSQFRETPSASGDRRLGYSTDHGTLSQVTRAEDVLLPPAVVQCQDSFGGAPFSYSWRQHAVDNNDLAVLRASTAVEPIPLAESEPRTDDDVMVLGFPTGTLPLETNKAEPIRRIGNVLRSRDTIQIDAVVLGGNSGGPLIDRNGEVVGVTTRGTAESLNMAIKVEHVRRLLTRARQGQ
jgi:hypothetical protein